MFLDYPIQIWLACIIAVMIRLQTNKKLTLLGALTTIVVALFAGVILYQPAITMFALSDSWQVPMAILIALSAENVMKAIVELSADREWLTDWMKFFIDRGASKRDRNNDENDDNVG